MSRKRLLHKVVVALLTLAVMCSSMSIIGFASTSSTAQTTDAGENSRAAGIYWVFKTVNGNKYKRLYDSTNRAWLSDWILVG